MNTRLESSERDDDLLAGVNNSFLCLVLCTKSVYGMETIVDKFPKARKIAAFVVTRLAGTVA